MINIQDKSQCCGCTACMAVCPKQCISMKEDDEGFLYPTVDTSLCIDCNLCQKVCPVLHQGGKREPLDVYAAKNDDEQVRLSSSSGGIFTQLAEKTIDEGGVVFGARFDENWEVMHDCTETREGIAAFRGSKYVQSRIGDCYQRAKQYLLAGRKVLFTGTSCQIAGLKSYLGKEYDNLLAVDVVCHGVPSPKVWRSYLSEIVAPQGGKNSVLPHPYECKTKITSIDFRSKSTGWKKFSFALTLSEASADGEQNSVLLSSIFIENPFMEVFLDNVSLRPSCYVCPVKAGKSQSDISIADFWGVHKSMPEFDDDKGVSLALVFTEKGRKVFDALSCQRQRSNLLDALPNNRSIRESVAMHVNRGMFFHLLEKKGFGEAYRLAYKDKGWSKRLRRLVYRKVGI